jgi:RNA polymerase sigma factor (sigma-70 family)
MHGKSMMSILHYLQRMAGGGSECGATDADLLRRFACTRDEAAFELMLGRHGPMVLGLCRRLLRHEQDAEDAFQATFLALARKAGSIARGQALAGWLHKVAYRVACRARKRIPVCTNVPALSELPAPDSESESMNADLRAVLDREIDCLPDRYRRVMILCYFEGKTHEEAARFMRLPKGTVAARLARARERLAGRLKRCGWTLTSAVLAGALATRNLEAAVPPELARTTLAAVLAYTGGKGMAGTYSVTAVTLTEGVLRMLWYSKLKMAAGGFLAMVLAGASVGLALHHGQAAGGAEESSTGQSQVPSRPNAVAANPGTKEKDGKENKGTGPRAEKNSDRQKLDMEKLRSQLKSALKEIKELKERKEAEEFDFSILPLGKPNAPRMVQVLTGFFQSTNTPISLGALSDKQIILWASPTVAKRIEKLLAIMDRADAEAAPEIRLWTLVLRHTRAADVAKSLQGVYGPGPGRPNSQEPPRFGGVRIAVDERSNCLILTCSEPAFQEAKKVVDQLENLTQDTPRPRTRMIPLKNASAAEVAKILRDLYPSPDQSIRFSADSRTNRVIVRAPVTLAEEINALVRELDAK